MLQRLILHAGTPKTGTTSLQVYLDRQRPELRRRGIWYPPTGAPAGETPKHQWLVTALMAAEGGEFRRAIEQLLETAEPGVHTLVLSTEGLFHHWWDFSAAGRSELAGLAYRLPTSVWTWFREPVAFVRSNYIQMLKNPPGYRYCYGRDLAPEEMLDDAWFARHLDYIGFVREVDAVMGRGTVVPFAYRGDTIDAFLNSLAVADLGGTHPSEHHTMRSAGVGLLRALNRSPASGRVRRRAVSLIGQLDTMLGPASSPLPLAPATVSRIQRLSGESLQALQRGYGLSLQRGG